MGCALNLPQANAARQRFVSPEGDHITLVNVMRSYTQEAVAGEISYADRKKSDKKMQSWCAQNYINRRSLRRSLDIRR